MRIDEAVDIVKEQTGREAAICSLTGSRNHRLETEDSDYDFKAFVIPTMDDMYSRNEYFKGIKGEGYEIEVHDLRKLPDLLWKSNPSFLEAIFAAERYMCPEMEGLFYANRERISGMNIPYLYNSTTGMFHNKMKYLEKGTANTQHLIEMHGYDTKQAMHAHRMLCVIRWFIDHGSFEKALIYYDPVTGSFRREFFLDIRNGKYTLDEMRNMLEKLFAETEEHYRDRCLGSPADKEMDSAIRTGTKEFILRHTEMMGRRTGLKMHNGQM